MTLEGKKIAVLIAPRGTEDPEFAEPRKAIEQAGGEVVVVGLDPSKAETVNQDLDSGSKYPVDATAGQVAAAEFDGLVIPGGTVGADKLRAAPEVVALVRGFFEAGKPVAAICHAPWVLIEADQVRGRTLTSFPSLRTDIENAGGTWVDQEVVESDGLITSRNPKDLPAFCERITEAFASARRAEPAGV